MSKPPGLAHFGLVWICRAVVGAGMGTLRNVPFFCFDETKRPNSCVRQKSRQDQILVLDLQIKKL